MDSLFDRSSSTGASTTRRSRRERVQRRKRTLRGAVAAVAVAGLLAIGLPTMAFADPADDPATDASTSETSEATTTVAPTEESSDPTDPATDPAESTPTPDEGSTEPTDEPADETSTEEPSETDEPTDAPQQRTVAPDEAQGDVGVFAVPPATGDSAVITVRTGDVRSTADPNSISALPGVQLGLYTTRTGGSLLFSCTADAAGDCSFVVPDTDQGGVNRDREMWVRQIAAPAGYFTNPTLRTGDAFGGDNEATSYSFRVGLRPQQGNTWQIRQGQTYTTTPPAEFMVSSGNTNRDASGGVWQTSRNNVAAPQQCGLDVALVMDLSGSVNSSIAQAREAGTTLVDALVGTPSNVGLFTFASSAPANNSNNQNRPITAVSTAAGAATVNGWINGLTAPTNGNTNWDRGLHQVAVSPTAYDVAIVLTDGNPTVYGSETNPGDFTRVREVENAIFSANAIKAENTRVIALGVGNGVSNADTALNLRAISGPIAYNGSNPGTADYYQTANYAAAGAALRQLALGNCQGSVSVVKQVVPPGGTIQQAQPTGGWAISATNPTAGVTVGAPNPANGQTGAGTGSINYPLVFAGGTTTGTVVVRETMQAGFSGLPQSGLNAVCRNLSDPAQPIIAGVTNNNTVPGQPGVNVPVSPSTAVSCTFYNQAPNPAATVVVDKLWAINGQPAIPHGQNPALTGSAVVNGQGTGFGNVVGGFSAGQTIPINETLGSLPTLCQVVSKTVTQVNGSGTNVPLTNPYQLQLVAGANTVQITNTVTCPTRLTLRKDVADDAVPTNLWTLDALTPGGGALAFPEGQDSGSGVTGTITPGVVYPLAESGGDPRYTQLDNRDPVLSVPGSTGSWACVPLDANGQPTGGNAGGLNGGVNVGFGNWVQCTAVNQTARLTLVKTLQPLAGITADPAAWNLTATPNAPAIPGLNAQTVATGQTISVRPGKAYTISESGGPAGWEQVSIQCDTGPNGTYVTTTTVTLPALDNATCVITNRPIPPKLSLDKVVTGSVAPDTAWTLSATRNDTAAVVASGAGGTPGFVTVPAGVPFTLAETTALPNADQFQAGTWQCSKNGGGNVPGPAVGALSAGDSVACVVTNTLKPFTPTVVKNVAVPTMNADGTWTITYTIDVKNPSAFGPVTYGLADQLGFGGDITILDADYAEPNGGPSHPFSGGFGSVQTFTAGRSLPAGATDTWTVVVQAQVDAGAFADPENELACPAPTSGDDGGFLNTATLSVNGQTVGEDDACAEPVNPTITKVGGAAVANGDGTWTLPYTITVLNPSATTGVIYDLEDALDLPASAEVVGTATVVSAPVPTVVGWTGLAPNTLLADGISLPGTPGVDQHVYQIAVTVRIGADDPASTCPSDNGLNNTATLLSGNQETDATGCVTVDTPDIVHEKSVVFGSVSQGADGLWTIAYNLVVTNTDAFGGTYSLADELHFGAGVDLGGAGYAITKDGVPYPTSWAGSGDLAVDAYLAGNTSTTYRITVTGIALDGPDLTPAQTACPSGATDGAFNNAAVLTVGGEDTTDTACDSPSAPTISKTGATAAQQPDGSWNVSYTLTAANTAPGAKPSFYSLIDDPQFPAGVIYNSYVIDGGPTVAYDGTTDIVIATDQPIAAGETDVFTIVLNVDVPSGSVPPADLECTVAAPTPGKGFFNEAVLTSGEIVRDDEECTDITDGGVPTVSKGDPIVTQDADGVWTAVYDVTVTGNADFITKYTLSDTLRFGPEVEILSAEWTGEGDDGDWTDPEANPTETIVGSPKLIGIDEVDTYTVTVTATVDAEAFADPTTGTCAPTDGAPNVGFLNEASLTSGATTQTDTGCGLPAQPEVVKSTVGGVVQVGDHWEAGYQITVRNLSADQGLVYDLSDTPNFTEDVTIVDREITSADVTVNPAWNGADSTDDTVVEDQALAGGVTHTFQVVVSFTVDDVPGDASHRCDGEGGQGLLNGALVVSGDDYESEACFDVPVVVELQKLWVIDGGDPIAWDSDALPEGFEATPTLDGDPVAWGEEYGPYVEDDEVSIDETDVVIPEGCELVGTDGTGVETLVDTYNVFTVTNEVDCEQEVTLEKIVDNAHGGDGVATDWTLSATNVGDDADTFSGDGSATGSVQVDTGYTLNEVSIVWEDGVAYEVSQTWACTSPQGDDAFTLVTSDGATNATLTVTQLGASVDCEIVNTDVAPKLTLVKTVEPVEVSGEFPPTLWTLTASDGGIEVLSGAGGATGEVDSNTPYTLAESADFPGADEFEGGDWVCTVTSTDPNTPAQLEGSDVTLDPGQTVTCEIVNTAKPAEYLVDKTVSSTEQLPDGSWVIVYSLEVENLSGVSPLTYDLEDDLDLFGSGITVDEASWTGPDGASGSWDDLPATTTTTLADDVVLPSATTHVYTITVGATVTEEAWEDETTECSQENVEEGGFRNVGTLTVDGLPTEVSACDEPGQATAEKLVTGPATNLGLGNWEVEYEITVTNDSDDDLFYDLSDTPAFPAGVSITSAVATDPNGDVVASWNGDTDTTLTTGDAIAAGTTEVWTITIQAFVANIVSIDTVDCVASETGNGFFNGATFGNGTIVTELDDCTDIPVGQIGLQKFVDNSAFANIDLGGLTPLQANAWNVLAAGLVNVGGIGSGQLVFTVPTGTYSLSETPNATGLANPLLQFYENGAWGCIRGGQPTDATVVLGARVDCQVTNVAEPVDVGIVKEYVLPEGQTAVEEGDAFEYTLTVTNNGTEPVTNVVVSDLLPDTLEITGPATFDPDSGDFVENTVGNQFSATAAGPFGPGTITTITIPVLFTVVPVDSPPAVGPDDPPPVIPPLDSDPIPNEACVEVDEDDLFTTNDCDEVDVPVKRIDSGAYVRCVNDVPWLYYDISVTDNVAPADITVTWTSADGTLTKVETIPWDARTGRLLWPGAAVDANGIPYAFPGWRPITEQDLITPPTPGTRFLDLILDETVPTYPWRDQVNPATITFSINPSEEVLAVYPQALPTCAIERPSELVIEKTASVTSTKSDANFSYTLGVTSVGTGAADTVEIFDTIPGHLRVDSITTDAAPAFPRWEDCEVTGEDSAGYGGTLHCDLLGVLGPNITTAPDIVLGVHVRPGTTASSIVNTGEVCWDDADTGDDVPDLIECADDTVTVSLPQKTAVTGFASEPWLWFGGGLMLLGGLGVAWVLIRRRRGTVSGD
ncbi:putative repeat protein (TIGR01451 family) [Agromyces sp. 3263]|uniref:VWA domain-containing protein n=1 Tax=Agromyces sp. 3263 TaxID=2817750 RepID=UPI0028575E4C|nr:VWA domain-containing protein [Agromyces sp. 3263]MDR6904696.1 putative repeat protein (TIGR01451 family) [Agromyces sp. 3263]